MYGTAVHQGLSKYLTAQDTHISPTSSNHSRPLSSHGNLLSLQSQSTIQEYKPFLCLILSKLIWKLVIALSWNNQIFPFLKSNGINRLPKSYQPLFMTKSIHRFIPPFRHFLLFEITVNFECHFAPASRSQEILKLSSPFHLGFS